MARRFRGEHTQKVDGKGRVSIPASFKRVIQANDPDYEDGGTATLIIVFGNDRRNYLECYTVTAMEKIEDAIERMPMGSPQRLAMEDFFSAKSEEVQVDGTGRLVMQKKLRDKIGLGGEAHFKSAVDRFQIWDKRKYEAEQGAAIQAVFDDLPTNADPLTLLAPYLEG